MFYLYILYSAEANKYYVGHSLDPWSRLIQHNENAGDKYTGKYNDWQLMAVFEAGTTRSEAQTIEYWIKRQKSRKLIEQLIQPDFIPDRQLSRLVRVPHLRD